MQAGTRLVGEAGSTMREVVDSVPRISAVIAEIAGNDSEQADGIVQVSETVGQMDGALRQNSVLVEEAAAAADALRRQATELAEAVGVLRLGAQETP